MAVIDKYVAHLARLGHQPTTIYARRQALARLAAFTATPLLDIDLDQLRAFSDRDGLGPAARRGEVNALRAFYGWAVGDELLDIDPTVRLERPSVPKRYPRPMPDRDVARVLRDAPERLRPWFHLAAYAGLRACEIAPLQGDDITDSHIVIRVQKGGDEGRVPICPALRPLLATFPADGWLFPALSRSQGPGRDPAAERDVEDRPITAAQLSNLANRWLRAEGIAHTFHSLRHWYVTNVYRVRRDIRATQRAARHRSITSTEGYAAVDDHEVASDVAQLPDLTTPDWPEAA